MKLIFSTGAWQDYVHWQSQDKKTLKRINRLIEECKRHPFEGTGKPESLRNELSGWWSRRINQSDRMVYRIVEKDGTQHLEIAQVRLHY